MDKLAQDFKVYIFTDYKKELPKNITKLDFDETMKMITAKQFQLFYSFTRPLGAVFLDDSFAKIRKRAI